MPAKKPARQPPAEAPKLTVTAPAPVARVAKEPERLTVTARPDPPPPPLPPEPVKLTVTALPDPPQRSRFAPPSFPAPGEAIAASPRYPYGITDYEDLLNKINAISGGAEPFSQPLQVDAPPPAEDDTALLLLGEDPLVGGNADGTVIGSNQPDGWEGDFINFQVDGDTVFRVDFSGALFLDGPILMTLPVGFTGDLIDLQIDGDSIFRVDENGDIYLNDVLFAPVSLGDSNVFTALQTLEITDTVNTGPATPLKISHRLSSGAAASGFSVRMEMNGEDDGGGVETMGIMGARASNTTDAAFSSTVEFLVRSNGSVIVPLELRGSPTLPGIQCNTILEAQHGLGIDFDAATLLGSLVGVFEVFDAFTQASRGYVPIYDGFTP